MSNVIIIGSGLAAYHLVKEFRKYDKQSQITLVTADDGSFYSKPLLSTGFHKNKTAQELVTMDAERMAAQLDINVMTFQTVRSINPKQKTINLGQGDLPYNKLILATGAECIKVPIRGDAQAHIYHINDLVDYHRFRAITVNKKRVLILGAGLIGCEYANDMVQAGYSVDVVDLQDSILPGLLPATAAKRVQHSLEQAGVRFHLGKSISEVSQLKQCIKAQLTDATTIEADVLLSAVGVRPRTSLASEAGLDCGRGIHTDRYLRTSNPDIYALGDCAEVDGQVLYYINPLMLCARALAKTLTGTDTSVNYPAMPVIIKTTLHPVVVNPPALGAKGEWQIEVDSETGVRALFKHNEQLLGFALTGDQLRGKELLARQCPPVLPPIP